MASVVGLDLSLTASGLAEVSDGLVVETFRVQSKGTKADDLRDRSDRLERLSSQIVDWVMEGDCDLVVIESPAYGAKFGSPHDRSGLWWLVSKKLISDEGYPVATVAPMTRAKYATGRGNARKADVFAAVQATYGPHVTSKYGIPDDNVADAILLAAMGARVLGEPVEAESTVPQSFLDSVQKMALPKGLVAA